MASTTSSCESGPIASLAYPALGMIAVGNMLPKSGPDIHSKPSNIPRYRHRVGKFMGIPSMLAGGVVFVAGLGATSSRWLSVLQIGSVVIVATSGALYAYLLAKCNSAQREPAHDVAVRVGDPTIGSPRRLRVLRTRVSGS